MKTSFNDHSCTFLFFEIMKMRLRKDGIMHEETCKCLDVLSGVNNVRTLVKRLEIFIDKDI